MADLTFIWIILIPLLASPVAYLFGRFSYRITGNKSGINLSAWIALAATLLAYYPLYLVSWPVRQGGIEQYQNGMIIFRFDGISLLVGFVTITLAALSISFSMRYLAAENGQEKFYALFLLMVGSIVGLACTADLFNLWVWFELMAISTYTLVAFYRSMRGALEAGVKYLVQSAIGSVMVLLGIALVFGQAGTLDLNRIRDITMVTPGLLAAGVLFIIGFGIKAALVPLHTWLPDAHSQAPSSISAMLSGIVIEAGLIALLRVLASLSQVSVRWGIVLLVLGAINMLVGNLMALRQEQIKRLLAYSSISHIGYILAGIGAAMVFGSVDGAQGGFFHLITHAFMKGLAFLSAGALLYNLVIVRGEHRPLLRDDLIGVSRRYPMEAMAFSIAVLALGGLPPLAGFMSKWQIFTSGMTTQNPWMIALVIFMALNSVLSLGYYAPLVNRLYRKDTSESVLSAPESGATMMLPITILAVLVIGIGLYTPAIQWISNVAGSAFLAALGM